MTINIVILSDGTGNSASSFWRTNVWRTFQALNLATNEQVAKYDDGVGTSSFLPLALLGGAFGWGLKRNILDAYKFVCRNYSKDEKLFFFGFSRGAFTVRVLASFILEQGLVQASSSESELHDLARKAYRAYRANGYHSIIGHEYVLRMIRDCFVRLWDKIRGRRAYDQRQNLVVPTIEFIGVWDTVAAYGLPADEMTRGFSNWIWPLELPSRELNSRVKFARHALALDDERTTFHPVLWTEEEAETKPSLDDQRLVQVWFVGMHANVGGGYPDDAVAFVPLRWMMDQASKRGLNFKSGPKDEPDAFKTVRSAQDKDGRLYDSRAGIGSYYRYGPRKIADLCNDKDNKVHIAVPKIHESVFARIDTGCNAYAPIGLPANYVTATDQGQLLPPGPSQFETGQQAATRAAIEERIWNYVWLRRILYFITLAATFHIAAFWLFHPLDPAHEFDNRLRMVSEAVRVLASFLPSALHWWTDWYATNPEWFVAGLIAIALLSMLGTSLSARIADYMRVVWRSRGAYDPVPNSPIQAAILGLRKNGFYLWVIWFARRHALPFLFFLSVVWFTLTAGSHLLFNIADSMGAFCHGDEAHAAAVNLGTDQGSPLEFDTSEICAPTMLKVREGYRYEITVQVTPPWGNDDITTDPTGFHTSSLSRWLWPEYYLSIPLRRILFRPWFRLVARVGETGVDEYFLDLHPRKGVANTYFDEFTADRSGELFLYVNDAVLAFPGLSSVFYKKNRGSAKISVKLL